MKKAIVLLALLFIVTGCSKTPELKYEGKDIVYFCTKEDIKLFESEVNVFAKKNQGFLSIEDGKWHEKINHEEDIKLEYKEKDNMDACYFINYDNMKHEFGTRTPISFRDKEEGSIRFHVKGNYVYTIHNMEKFGSTLLFYDNLTSSVDFDSAIEAVYNLISTEINATYILNLGSKTFADLQNEKEFTEEMIESVNLILRDRYGIELTKVSIESVEKVS